MTLSKDEREKINETHDSCLRIETMLEHCNVKTHEKRISRLEWTWGAILAVGGVIGSLALTVAGFVAGWFKQ